MDRSRSFALLDYEYCGAIVALGAATENLILSAYHAGWDVRLQSFPAAEVSDWVARFQFLPLPDSTSETHWRDDLYPLLRVRHTNRKLSVRQPLTPDAMEALTAAVCSIPGANVQWLQVNDELEEIGQLLGAADRLRIMNEAFHRELLGELRWTRAEAEATRDGIEVPTLELSPSDEAGLRISSNATAIDLIRQWRGGRNLEKMAQKAVTAASAVGLITMLPTHHQGYFQGGRAVERCWLTATEHKLAFHPMTALPYLFARLLRGNGAALRPETQMELRALRRRYERLFDVQPGLAEVLLFRVSVAEETKMRSLRRSVQEVLHIS